MCFTTKIDIIAFAAEKIVYSNSHLSFELFISTAPYFEQHEVIIAVSYIQIITGMAFEHLNYSVIRHPIFS